MSWTNLMALDWAKGQAVATCVGIPILLITLILQLLQERLTRRSLALTVRMELRKALIDLNATPDSDSQALCIHRFNYFQAAQWCWDSGVLDRDTWQAELRFMREYMWTKPLMPQVWGENRDLYTRSLMRTLDPMANVLLSKDGQLPIGKRRPPQTFEEFRKNIPQAEEGRKDRHRRAPIMVQTCTDSNVQ